MTPSAFLAQLAGDLDALAAKCRDYAMIAAWQETESPLEVVFRLRPKRRKREGKPVAATIQPDATE